MPGMDFVALLYYKYYYKNPPYCSSVVHYVWQVTCVEY